MSHEYSLSKELPLWRGDLSPLGREAALNADNRCVRQIELAA
ncbi:hypothetical protein SAMN03159474_01901 [Pseudomonas sp. NFACC08-1]|nr:hypothetical protein SAMN03159474_01901 [Pseudomonas sp. NFACC08-1]SFL94141.1 hypothetical protein SAMN03159307_05044 [Pseudomonas sp. NFACC46-3]